MRVYFGVSRRKCRFHFSVDVFKFDDHLERWCRRLALAHLYQLAERESNQLKYLPGGGARSPGEKEAKISKLYWLIINHYRSARPGDDVNGMTYGGCCFFGNFFFALCGARFFGQIISGWNGFVADLRGHSSLASMRRQQRGGNSDLWLY